MNERSVTDRTETLNLYCNLMGELKRRYSAMSTLTGLAVDKKLPVDLVAECCWLQLRMMCELIALGCLVAHDDIKTTRTGKIRTLWSADKIIDELNKLHPDFYPRPAKAITNAEGSPVDIRVYQGPAKIDYFTGEYLSKSNLCSLAIQCGEELHRGSLKRLKSDKPKRIDYSDFEKWGAKIRRLLSIHEIVLIDSDYRLWIDMGSKLDDKVHGWFVAAQGLEQ